MRASWQDVGAASQALPATGDASCVSWGNRLGIGKSLAVYCVRMTMWKHTCD